MSLSLVRATAIDHVLFVLLSIFHTIVIPHLHQHCPHSLQSTYICMYIYYRRISVHFRESYRAIHDMSKKNRRVSRCHVLNAQVIVINFMCFKMRESIFTAIYHFGKHVTNVHPQKKKSKYSGVQQRFLHRHPFKMPEKNARRAHAQF